MMGVSYVNHIAPSLNNAASPCGGVGITPVRSKRTRALSAGGIIWV